MRVASGRQGNTLKDSFYKERLIKSSANSLYNTFNQTFHRDSHDSDDEMPANMTMITPEEQSLVMENHLQNFNKTAEGSGYAFLRFQCTHKMLRSINRIRGYEFLQEIDLSYNKLKSLKYLSGLKYLVKVKATNNQLTNIFDVKKPPLHLDYLDVSSNKIKSMSDMSMHKHLRVLNLKSNSISQIQGILRNKKLEILDISENSLQQIGGLDGLNLKELYLGSNSIQVIKGMTKLENLRTLDLSINKIKKLGGLISLVSIRSLDLSKNLVRNVRQIDYLENLIYLSNLDLCFNPIQERRYYRLQIIYKLPMLKSLDGTPPTSEQNVRAEEFYGLYVQESFSIFKTNLPQQQFIDRRIHRSEMIDNETDSEGEQNNFIDNYDEEGKVRSNSSKSRNRSFNASKRSMASRGSKLSKKSNILSKA